MTRRRVDLRLCRFWGYVDRIVFDGFSVLALYVERGSFYLAVVVWQLVVPRCWDFSTVATFGSS